MQSVPRLRHSICSLCTLSGVLLCAPLTTYPHLRIVVHCEGCRWNPPSRSSCLDHKLAVSYGMRELTLGTCKGCRLHALLQQPSDMGVCAGWTLTSPCELTCSWLCPRNPPTPSTSTRKVTHSRAQERCLVLGMHATHRHWRMCGQISFTLMLTIETGHGSQSIQTSCPRAPKRWWQLIDGVVLTEGNGPRNNYWCISKVARQGG